MLAYFNSAMLFMYQIDSYALDLLAYTLILLCSDRQLCFGPVSIYFNSAMVRSTVMLWACYHILILMAT
jgi:hypothetical protein